MKIITSAELQEKMHEHITLFDIRAKEDFEKSSIKNATHINLQQIDELYPTLNKTMPMVIYCYRGVSSQRAAHLFEELGFSDVYSLQGGYTEWLEFISTAS